MRESVADSVELQEQGTGLINIAAAAAAGVADDTEESRVIVNPFSNTVTFTADVNNQNQRRVIRPDDDLVSISLLSDVEEEESEESVE
jgi:hypothetical protein